MLTRIEVVVSKSHYNEIANKYKLTKRERQLGFLKLAGFSNYKIAQCYGISVMTVKKHFTHIYEKMFVPGRKEFVQLFEEEIKIV